jgi:hypothetical protein
MMPRPLTAAALLALAACEDDEHAHDHDHAPMEVHGAPAEAHPAALPAAPGGGGGTPAATALGSWTATLEATAEGLRLRAADGSGAPVAPAGEVRVVLTGTGEDEQRVTLAPGADGWSGAARAAGARGYVAVVSVEVDGRTESARFSWGEVPQAAPAPKGGGAAGDHDDDHGGCDGHGHGH